MNDRISIDRLAPGAYEVSRGRRMFFVARNPDRSWGIEGRDREGLTSTRILVDACYARRVFLSEYPTLTAAIVAITNAQD